MMRRVVLVAAIEPGHAHKVRELLRAGPPFDVASTSLERHEVFLAEDSVVFAFEGLHADAELDQLLRDPGTLGAASRLAEHLASDPRLAEEAFSWERPEDLEGVDFGPHPGPGDSEGGESD